MTDTHRIAPVPVALALIDRRWPPVPALSASPGAEALSQLATDPRYLAGRLQQALTVLLADPAPPSDALTALLSQALADAVAWRLHHGRPCDQCDDALCAACSADWDQIDHYHELARALGATGTRPGRTRPLPERTQ